MNDLTEKQWAAQIADLAKTLGWLRYHTYRSERSPAGFPDEVLVRDRVIFMELKRASTKPSPLQVEWLDRLALANAEVYLARPGDLEEIARVLGHPWKLNDGLLGDSMVSPHWTPGCMWIAGQGRCDELVAAA